MENRSIGAAAAILVTLLCGLPGLFMVCLGTIAIPASFYGGSDINLLGNSDPQTALLAGIAVLALGIIFILISAALVIRYIQRDPAAHALDRLEPYDPEIYRDL